MRFARERFDVIFHRLRRVEISETSARIVGAMNIDNENIGLSFSIHIRRHEMFSVERVNTGYTASRTSCLYIYSVTVAAT